MADAADIGVKIAIEGEAEFKKAIKDITSETKKLQSEMKLTSNVYADNASGVQSLTSKGEVLQKQIGAQREKVDALNKALENAEKNFAGNTEKINDYAKKLNYAKSDLIDLERAQRENNEALEVAAKGTDELGSKQEEATGKGGKFGNVITSLADLFGIKLPGGISTGIDSLGLFDNKMTGTKDATAGGFDDIAGSIGGLDPAAAGAIAAITGIGIAAAKMTAETIIEIDKLSARMQVALGLTDEEAKTAGTAIEALYLSPMIDSRDEAEKALTAVMRLMDASGEEAVIYGEKVATINKVWGEDFSETAQTASTLMKEFGITGEEAFDIIVTGLQSSANKNGDLLDVLNEYSPSFKRLGDDADTFLSRLVAGAEAGAQSVNIAADVYKELFNKAADGNADFIWSVDALGLSSKRMVNDLLAGGTQAQNAVELIMTKLSNMQDKTKQNQIASKLLGSQWEDVGTQSVLAMGNITGALVDSTGKSTKAVGDMVDTASSKWDTFWKKVGNAVWQQGKGTIWNAIDTINAYGNIPGNASGTDYWQGGPTWVGERGAEIVVPPRGSQIIPHGQSVGGDTYNTYVNSRDMSSAARVCAVQERMKQRSRAKGR